MKKVFSNHFKKDLIEEVVKWLEEHLEEYDRKAIILELIDERTH